MIKIGGVPLDEKLPYVTHQPKILSTGFVVQPVDWRDEYQENKGEGEAWADNEAAPYGGRSASWWRQNMEMELIKSGEPRYPMISSSIHIRTIPYQELLTPEWCCYRSFDYGITLRSPSCCAWLAVNRRGDKYFYRQYYRRDADVLTIAKEIHDDTPIEERIIGSVGDPSIWRRLPTSMTLLADVFAQSGFPMMPADNTAPGYESVAAGFMSAVARFGMASGNLDIVRKMLNTPELARGTIENLADRPAIWFSPECAQGELSLFQQCVNLRYRSQRGDVRERAPTVKVADIDDEGPDVVRYAVHTPVVRWTSSKPMLTKRERVINDIWQEQEDRHADEMSGRSREGVYP